MFGLPTRLTRPAGQKLPALAATIAGGAAAAAAVPADVVRTPPAGDRPMGGSGDLPTAAGAQVGVTRQVVNKYDAQWAALGRERLGCRAGLCPSGIRVRL